MAQDDYQLLEEYTVWREDKLLHEVDTSVEAFKAEREAGANARRIVNALGALDYAMSKSKLIEMANAVDEARSHLTEGRKFTTTSSLTSPFITREYTD